MIQSVKYFLICLFILCLFSRLFSEEIWKLKGGMNFSWFESAERTKSGVGYIVELQRSLGRAGPVDLFLGLNLQSRSVVLTDRTVAYLLPDAGREIALTDIHASLAFIEIPLITGFSFDAHYFSVFPYVGGVLSFVLADNTSLDRKKLIYSNSEIPDLYAPDFSEGIESTFGNNSTDIVLDFGIEVHFKRYLLDLRYIIDLRDGIWVDKIDKLNYRTRGWSVLVGYKI
jgi:hypothetical protein